MKKKTVIALTCGIAVLILGAVLYGLPYAAVYDIISALQGRDKDRLVRVVDFPAVQAGVRQQVRASLPAQAPSADLDKIRQALTAKLIDAAVEQMVTPDGLIAIFDRNLADMAGDAGEPQASRSPSRVRAAKIFAAVLRFTDCGYLSASEFTIIYDDRQGRTIRFLLARSGLQWRLTHIQLPLSAGNNAK